MPEKSLTVATYAAGASLAAITLIYVFAPTYLIDSDGGRSASSHKRGVVGLSNPANDCFINSILQALAGLGDLRIYLIRETHRRSLDAAWVYEQPVPADALQDRGDNARDDGASARIRGQPDWKVVGLQSGAVTKGLKRILDQLNERPIYKKTASALPFVKDLESAFRQRISRQQQDAQEFLQVVAERLCEEYHAGQRARRYARTLPPPGVAAAGGSPVLNADLVDKKLQGMVKGEAGDEDDNEAEEAPESQESIAGSGLTAAAAPDTTTVAEARVAGAVADDDEEEEGFPMEGMFESQIECLTCGFKPRAKEDRFCTLTLNVPQVSSTTLNACFDGMFKTEYIDDFKCEKCRLLHVEAVLESELARTPESRADEAEARRKTIEALQHAIATDPERPPEWVALPDAKLAPKRRIARHIQMTSFPKILAVHLSRSIYERSQSSKNSAKVAFPERLPLGGLLNRRKYKLLGVVAHKGSHHSGHYESFRRQNVYPPFSTPNNSLRPSDKGPYGRSTTTSAVPSPAATPRVGALRQRPSGEVGASSSTDSSPLTSTPDLLLAGGATTPASSASTAVNNASPSPGSNGASSSDSAKGSPRSRKDKDGDSSSLRSVARSTLSRITPSSRSASRSGSRSGGGGGGNNKAAATTSTSLGDGSAHQVAHNPIKMPKRKKNQDNMWWRLSDDKVKEATTKDVLGMQREVYLLFYEMEKDGAP
ncbi:hypothetical protein GGTG_09663 [Gaeumannomyces tritici R3-111a-1]|uniref:Ubiquitin carboxyl-terminal hydrolase n=1 Tax=Gaeumannomyces tritici (strain R3-111a-1) TaxID=644352 RepID=J3P825_GAET3|nr:hypothetical protein GGTG_09663 [Gaeumannomyces tritici R3-111a-1]EJT72808.1 hypothetical protein GGTG_09663 [Gaeumannomyces tritici R3-111a-1]